LLDVPVLKLKPEIENQDNEDSYEEMSILEIINNNKEIFAN
jgi:hypothetical protein